ncbi:Pyridoxal kinase [Salipiger mucosus DSM 16094]|uniref:pyridoxal kinase n=2 Tax=Salipiger mucosus TaxID=263378 RepID=S9SI22_9RHOB|nr:Pyridoxal kinase [Salipiger mucosus DSM 16094]
MGGSAAAPVLRGLGHEVMHLPTTMLSNHPGFDHVAGGAVPVAQLATMRDALAANGWLTHVDAVLTGYLPSPEHVALAAETVRGLGAPRVVVDPVLGDAPGGLYLPEAVGEALRTDLLPLADVATPNRFELGWLSRRPCESARDCAAAARALPVPRVIVTSAPAPAGQTGVTEVTTGATRHWRTPQRRGVPHGVGDAFAGLIAAGLAPGAALGHLDALIEASLGAPHLAIAESAARWTHAAPLPHDPCEES